MDHDPPRGTRVAAIETLATSSEMLMNGQPLTILHVEDNADHAQLIARSLRKNRVANDIRHVLDGEEALDYLFQRGKYTSEDSAPRPQIVLLDLRLPKVDGLEVLKTIKTTEELCSIPVVILTSSEAEKDVAHAYEYHANSYLVKPVGFDRFSELMEQLGFYWLAWNRYPWILESEGGSSRGAS